MKQFSTWVTAAVLTVGVVALTACGSSKSTSTKTPTASGAGGATSASQQAPTSASAAPATPLSAIVLQAADLPSTFTKAPAQAEDANDAVEQAKVATCAGVKSTASDKLESAKSSFDLGDSGISSDASRFKSASDIASDVKMLHSPRIDQCLQESARRTIAKGMPAGAKVDNITVHVTHGSSGGPSNVVALAQGTVTVTISGQTVKVYTTAAFITGPRIEAEVDVTGVGAPLPAATQRQAIDAVAARAAKG
jgi:hypothetical protein